MEPNTIFMWTAGAAATITSALAIRAAWTQYNAAIADANTLRFQLERAHTLVDQMTDQVASMNRTIGELRSEIKTAKAKQAVADIDAKANSTNAPLIRPTQYFKSTKSQDYDTCFISNDIDKWVEVLPQKAKRNMIEARRTNKYVYRTSGSSRKYFVRLCMGGVRYQTPSFGSRARAVTWLNLLGTVLQGQNDQRRADA